MVDIPPDCDKEFLLKIPSTGDISRLIKLPRAEDCPPVTLILGTCRCGSSALLQAIAASGYVAYFQPLKRIVRNILLRSGSGSLVVQPNARQIAIKETFGPFVPGEIYFDPAAILCEAGYPPEKICVLSLFRNPRDVFNSWILNFGNNPILPAVEFRLFAEAYLWNFKLFQSLKARGFETIPYAPDAFRSIPPSKLLKGVFGAAGLEFSDYSYDWRTKAAFGAEGSFVVRDTEPGFFRSAGILDDLKHSSEYKPQMMKKAEHPLGHNFDGFSELDQCYAQIVELVARYFDMRPD